MHALGLVLHQLKKACRSFVATISKKPIISITLSLAILGGVAFFIVYQCIPHNPSSPLTAILTNEPPKERRAIDGVWVEKGMANPPLVAVIIENAADAQPLSGLDKASIVYEAIVEGTITRLMAVIAVPADAVLSDDRIGPIRSVRPYYLTWATELGAMLVHIGGSPAALNTIRAQGLTTLNEFYNASYFHRNRERYAPHNTYTTTIDLAKAINKKLVGTSLERWSKTLPAWQFKDDAKISERGTTKSIRVGYAGSYAVTWEYNTESNDYTRMQWGGADTLSNGAAIKAKNIAVIAQRMAVIDEISRKQFTTEGTGTAYLFRDGRAHQGTWQKDSPSGRMRLYDDADNEMQLNAGTTWIEIVPTNTKITY